MNHRNVILVWVLALAAIGANAPQVIADDATDPTLPVKLIFIHHSTGGYWLATHSDPSDLGGNLGQTLMAHNYFVSATNYGWGPNQIGSSTDIPNWPEWFTGPNRDTIMAAVYSENNQNICNPSSPSDDCFGDWPRLATDPGGENEIVMFKSCFPNSDLYREPSDQMTVEDAQAVYTDILTYFATRQDKLFVVITAPPLMQSDTAPERAANARAFNNWLMNDWLAGYSYKNVAVFDYYNVLTSNGSAGRIDDPSVTTEPNDYASRPDGNHHYWNGSQVTHTQTIANNFSAYPSGDSHPTSAGHQKATLEFVTLLNVFYHRWKSGVTPIGPPTNLLLVPFALSWEDDTPADHEGFKIERKTGVSGTYVQIGTVGAAVRAYTDSDPGLLADTTYCYRVRAYSAAGDSAYSNEACGGRFTLTVSKSGTGAGTVTSIPTGINCGSACIYVFPSTTLVTLTATASTGSAFTGWSGGGCTGTASCAVTMNQTQNVTATFAVATFTLTVSIRGSSGGSVTSSPAGISGCTGTCAASFDSGTLVTLTATPGSGGTFREWRGACTGSGTCVVTMTAAKTVTAVFSKTFTDPTLSTGVTAVKAVHFTELRSAIDTLRARNGLAAFAWTDPTLTAGVTQVKRLHLLDLRNALNAAYTAAGQPAPTYAETITAGTTFIKASHLTELRNRVRALE